MKILNKSNRLKIDTLIKDFHNSFALVKKSRPYFITSRLWDDSKSYYQLACNLREDNDKHPIILTLPLRTYYWHIPTMFEACFYNLCAAYCLDESMILQAVEQFDIKRK